MINLRNFTSTPKVQSLNIEWPGSRNCVFFGRFLCEFHMAHGETSSCSPLSFSGVITAGWLTKRKIPTLCGAQIIPALEINYSFTKVPTIIEICKPYRPVAYFQSINLVVAVENVLASRVTYRSYTKKYIATYMADVGHISFLLARG